MDSSPTKTKTKTKQKKQTQTNKNPRKDYFVMTRQAGGTQYLYHSERYFSSTALEFD